VAATVWAAWSATTPATIEASSPIAASASSSDPDAELTPARRARVDAVRAELRGVRPLWEATQLDEALRLSADLLTEARAIDHPPLVAAVGVDRAWVLYETSRFDEASALLVEVHEIAWAHGLDDLAAESASIHAAVSEHLDDVEGGLAWARRAQSAIERLPAGERDEAMALLASARAHLLETAGRLDEARADAELALELTEGMRPADDPLLGSKHKALGNVLVETDPEAALGHYAHALEIVRDAYGDDHPDVALVLLDIGALHEGRGDADVALPYAERALEIFEASYGSEHHHVGTALYNLGVIQEELDDDLAAAALFHRAAATWEATLGPNHRRVALPITLLAYISFNAGDLATAEEHYQRALVLYEEGLGPDHTECTTPLSGLAEIAILQGRGDRAVAFAERALAIASNEPEADLAARRFRLARALDVAGREDESTRLAEHALGDLRRSGDPSEADEVEQWLADREALRRARAPQ
jgi:tetratricopeptide (TPR) repeat protein